jgi:serine/threonine-protein kinase RsbW
MTRHLSFLNVQILSQSQRKGKDPTLTELSKSEMVSLDLPASFKFLSLIGASVRSMLEPESELPDPDCFIYQAELAVHEACTNIIEHAYASSPGRIKIQLLIEEAPRRLVVDLFDTGIPFDTNRLQKMEIPEPKSRGYGLFLIQELMDRVAYSGDSGTNHWHLEKNF